MRILETKVNSTEKGCFEITIIIEAEVSEYSRSLEEPLCLPEGAFGPIDSRAIPDEIVRELIQVGPPYSLSLPELHRRLNKNPATINRQAWTLATNQPDLQIRLRGWVHSPKRGRYALTCAAIRNIEGRMDQRD